MSDKQAKRNIPPYPLSQIGPGAPRNASRLKRGEAAIWQRRYWEHTIRDQDDLDRHTDYIHYNPVKHGLVKRATDWPWSSFHRYVREGYYKSEWSEAMKQEVKVIKCGEWSIRIGASQMHPTTSKPHQRKRT